MTDTPHVEVPIPDPLLDELGVYVGEDGEHRWTLFSAGNHKVIGASTEGYKNREDCVENALRVTGRKAFILDADRKPVLVAEPVRTV